MTAFWALTTSALLIFIVLLSKQLNDASARRELGLSLDLKSLLLGASLVDVSSLCLTGVYLASIWYVKSNDTASSETAKYCVQLLWREVLLDASMMLFIILAIAWMRQSLLLKDVPLSFGRPMVLKTLRFGDVTSCLSTIVDGPSHWFIVAVLAGLLLLTIVNDALKGDLQLADIRLCTAEPTVSKRLLVTIVVVMFVFWWTVTVLTANVLKRGRQRAQVDGSQLFSVWHLTDNPGSLSTSVLGWSNDNDSKKSSRLPLFLAMTSVWLAPVQCLVTMTVLEFSRMTTVRVVFLIWIYSCTATLLSLILSICVCVCLPDNLLIYNS